MIGLPCGEETMTICYAVFTEYQNATDGQTDGRTELQYQCCTSLSTLTRNKNEVKWKLLRHFC